VGFTNGIAVLIASTQIKDFFGLKIAKVPGDFVGRMSALAANFGTLSKAETILGVCSLALILLCARYIKRVPGYIVALVFGTTIVYLFDHVLGGGGLSAPHLFETIGTRFGGIPHSLPRLQIPEIHFHNMATLIAPAITVAMLGAIESLLSAVVADRMSREKHDPNQELMAQGLANIFSPLFGGIPATGAIARTATNIRAGARTPVAGIVHSFTLLMILLLAAPLASYIPLASLSAILFVVSYNMGEWHEIPLLMKLGRSDIATWLVTFALTVFADLTVAVEFGMILAALLFIRNVAETTSVSEVTPDDIAEGESHVLQGKDIPSYVSMYRIHGPFLFGTTEKLNAISRKIAELQPVVILRLRNMTALDATGLLAIETLAGQVNDTGRAFIICGSRPQPAALLHQAEFERHIGKENICETVSVAVARAREIYPQVSHVQPKPSPHRRRGERAG
jgi:sulfate permease, SulP family